MQVEKQEYGQVLSELVSRMEEESVRKVFELAQQKAQQILRAMLEEQERLKRREIVCGISGRIKQPESIARKLIKKKLPVTFENAVMRLNDLVGVRVTCYYLDDVRMIGELIKVHKEIHFIKEKDYIEKPKSSGYRSLHLIVEVPVLLGETEQWVRMEIQIRTMAMDMWARLDHRLCYKKESKEAGEVAKDLREYAQLVEKVDIRMMSLRRRIDAIGSR